jgi:hypothetical protein
VALRSNVPVLLGGRTIAPAPITGAEGKKTMRTRMLVAGAAFVMLLACANQKEPAEKAFTKIETSLGELRADAQHYAAGQLKNVEESVDGLRSKLEKQDYRGVMVAAPGVSSEVNTLRANVTRMKAEAEEILATAQSEWSSMTSSVPQLVTDLQARVDSFSRSRRLPKNFSQQEFSVAKATVADIKKVWDEASAEAAQGKVADAVRKARAVKINAEYLLRRLAA